MATQDPTGRGAIAAPSADDREVEAGVLSFVLSEHPSHLTIAELSLAINRRVTGEFPSDDAVERAVGELVGAGLLRLCAGLVSPSRSALYFDGLEVG
jgi:hypothetical protein